MLKKMKKCALAVSLSLAITPSVGAASVIGFYGNFDVINDTGITAHGFEIELEGLHSADITDTFGGPGRGVPTGRGFDPSIANPARTTSSWLLETENPGELSNGGVTLPAPPWEMIPPAPGGGVGPAVVAQILAPSSEIEDQFGGAIRGAANLVAAPGMPVPRTFLLFGTGLAGLMVQRLRREKTG